MFSSSAALFGKLRREKFSFRQTGLQNNVNRAQSDDGLSVGNSDVKFHKLQSSRSRVHSIRTNSLIPSADPNLSSNSSMDMVYSILTHIEFYQYSITRTSSGIFLYMYLMISVISGTNFSHIEQSANHAYAFFHLGSSNLT